MKIICIGDSLTEGDYGVFGKSGIANVKEKNYPYFLQKLTNAEVVNYGKCGLNSTSYLEYFKNNAVDVSGADYIIIMLGSNGGLDANSETQANIDYDELVQLCRIGEPIAQIVLCTPPHVTVNPNMSNCGYRAQVESAVSFVREYAKKNDIPLIDLANCKDFTDETEHIMQPNDGLHFSEAGYQKIAEFVYDSLKQLFGINK